MIFRWTGWWQAPVLGIAYTNLDLALGNRANELVARDLLTRNDHGTEWMIDKYVDDQSESLLSMQLVKGKEREF